MLDTIARSTDELQQALRAQYEMLTDTLRVLGVEPPAIKEPDTRNNRHDTITRLHLLNDGIVMSRAMAEHNMLLMRMIREALMHDPDGPEVAGYEEKAQEYVKRGMSLGSSSQARDF